MRNALALKASTRAGCFYCITIFDPCEVWNYCDDGGKAFPGWKGKTALCPYCQIDSVIAQESTSIPITKELLQEMYERWFSVGAFAPVASKFPPSPPRPRRKFR